MEDFTGNSENSPHSPQDNPQEQNAEFSDSSQGVSPEPQARDWSSADSLSEPDKNSKLWATFCHLSALLGLTGFVFGFFLGPLVLWLIKKDEMPFVDANGKNALNFQISMMIYGVVTSLLMCIPPLGLIIWGALTLIDVIFTIIATINANNGQVATYPISIKFIK